MPLVEITQNSVLSPTLWYLRRKSAWNNGNPITVTLEQLNIIDKEIAFHEKVIKPSVKTKEYNNIFKQLKKANCRDKKMK